MALNRGFNIAGEVGVECGGRSVFPGQTQRLGKQSDMGFGGTDHGYGQLIALDDDLRTGAHPFQQLGKVASRFRRRNVDHMVSHEVIISCWSTRGGVKVRSKRSRTSSTLLEPVARESSPLPPHLNLDNIALRS